MPEVNRRREALTHRAQPSRLARPLPPGFPFGFFPGLRCAAPRASAAAASRHAARSDQTNTLPFLLARIRPVRSARPRCVLANRSDVMKAAVSNASRRGKMWRSGAIDGAAIIII